MGMLAGGKPCKSYSECCSGRCTSGICDVGVPCTISNRNGYCTVRDCIFSSTLTHAKCPTGSVCNHLFGVGLCQKTCSLTATTGATSCRGYAKDKMGDYECRSWDALSTSSTSKIAATPVCDFGSSIPCSTFSGSSISCALLGTYSGTTNTNTTHMTCRDLKNTKLTNKYDPKGWCFDDTASGPVGP